MADGIRLFVFGSFARGDARPTSDLDLGFEALPSAVDPVGAAHRLRDRLEDLPTIRPADLVDFARVTVEFREHAGTCVIPLGAIEEHAERIQTAP